jgi:hypothetical protein
MAVVSVTKLGFLKIAELLTDLHGELTKVHPNGKQYFKLKTSTAPTTSSTSGKFIYEGTSDIDPLAEYQVSNSNITSAWRVCFNLIDEDRLAVHLGTSLQLPDSGTIAFLNDRREKPSDTATDDAAKFVAQIEPPGNLSELWAKWKENSTDTTSQFGSPDKRNSKLNWIDRAVNNKEESANRAYPMSYMLSMSNRGIYLGVWEDSQEEIPQTNWETSGTVAATEAQRVESDEGYGKSPFRWFVVQRAVDRLTGHVRGGGPLRGDNDPELERSRCPVFCVGGTTNPKNFFKFIVRELDVVSPSRKKYAAVNTTDSPAVLNPFPQNSITESGEYVVSFINNLSTPRFRYSDELDMVGTVGAEVVGGGSVIDVKVYGESTPRTYTAAYATRQYGTGMRIMVLTAADEATEDSHVQIQDSVTVTANTSVVTEGNAVSFDITTTNVANGAGIYWTNVGTTTAADFTDNRNSGYIRVFSNTASIVRTLANDITTETGTETIQLELRRRPGVAVPVVATSSAVTVTDLSFTPSYTITPNVPMVHEGNTVGYTITTVSVPGGTPVYWTNTGTTTAVDLVGGVNNGVVILDNNGNATLQITPRLDSTTETLETLIVNLAKTVAGPSVATAATVNVIDSSLTPTYIFDPAPPASVNEGGLIVYTLKTTYVPVGTTLYWNNIGTTNARDFNENVNLGNVSVQGSYASGFAYIALQPYIDSETEGTQTLILQIRTDSQVGTVVATAASVNVADTSVTPPIPTPPTPVPTPTPTPTP